MGESLTPFDESNKFECGHAINCESLARNGMKR